MFQAKSRTRLSVARVVTISWSGNAPLVLLALPPGNTRPESTMSRLSRDVHDSTDL